MEHTVQIPVSGDWSNLNDLVQSKLEGDGKAEIRSYANLIELFNDNTDPLVPEDCRLQWTSDPTASAAPAGLGLLPEVSKEFTSSGIRNNVSMMDKWIRLVDSAGDPVVGTAIVRIVTT